PRNRQRALIQADHRRQAIAPPLFGVVDDERIVHLPPRLEDGAFVDDRGLLLLRLPQMQCALQAPAFEYGQRDGRSDDKLPGRPISETRKLKGLEPRTAVQRY